MPGQGLRRRDSAQNLRKFDRYRRQNRINFIQRSSLCQRLTFYTPTFCMLFWRPTVASGLLVRSAMPETMKSTDRPSGHAVRSRFSLAARLYSIFALFALLTAAITALSDYNTRRNADLTKAIETGSRAALNVERVNSLVYAVVMESRGIYMSTEAAAVKTYGDGL